MFNARTAWMFHPASRSYASFVDWLWLKVADAFCTTGRCSQGMSRFFFDRGMIE